MTHRRSYQEDPSLGDRVFGLLSQVFPGVQVGRHNAAAFGAPWEAGSIPFVAEAAGQVIGHVGLLPVPLRIMGRDVGCGGVHGVATHPDFRRQGYFRALLQELVAYAQSRFETLFLTTLHPEYFTGAGFRVIPEYTGLAQLADSAPIPSRLLGLDQPADLNLLHRLIDTRHPVSDLLGVGPEQCCWGFTEFGSTIYYAESLGVAVVAEQTGKTLRIYDVIGRTLPSVSQLAGICSPSARRVLLFMGADRFPDPVAVLPQDLSGGDDALEPGTANWVLMVRGPFAAEERPVFLPRSARC